MTTASGSIEIPLAAEWQHLRREREALRDRLRRLDAERGRVSDAVLERVRADYERQRAGLETRAQELAHRAEREERTLVAAVERQQVELREHNLAIEEFDLRERLGEALDPDSARRARELRGERNRLQEDLRGLVDLRDRVMAIAAGRLFSGTGEPGAPVTVPAPLLTRPHRIDTGGSAPHPEQLSPLPPPLAPARPALAPRLVPAESPDGIDAFLLSGPAVVGRNPESDLRLPIGTVSRRHAELAPSAEGWVVRDLHSENGTWVNGERVWERVLCDGDQVHFGTVCLVFRAR